MILSPKTGRVKELVILDRQRTPSRAGMGLTHFAGEKKMEWKMGHH